MREILFKAKRWKDGKWIFGDLFQNQNDTIIHHYVDGCRVVDSVDPRTVCQYTGKTDKNGVKIFECDEVILEYAENFTRKEIETVVFWDDDSASFVPFSWEHSCDECESCLMITSVEVTGNILDEEE